MSQLIYSYKIKDALDVHGTVLWSVAASWLIYCYILTDLHMYVVSIVAQVGG